MWTAYDLYNVAKSTVECTVSAVYVSRIQCNACCPAALRDNTRDTKQTVNPDTNSVTSLSVRAPCLAFELCGGLSVWDAHQWELVVVVSDVIYMYCIHTYLIHR